MITLQIMLSFTQRKCHTLSRVLSVVLRIMNSNDIVFINSGLVFSEVDFEKRTDLKCLRLTNTKIHKHKPIRLTNKQTSEPALPRLNQY